MRLNEARAEKNREERAIKAVERLGVKYHLFEPSGREVWTVVGSDVDFLVYPNLGEKTQGYCSCDDYHFRVLSGSIPECYHLIAIRKAMEENRFSKIIFSDEEYEGFMRALLKDIFSHIS